MAKNPVGVAQDDIPINKGFGQLPITDAIKQLNNFGSVYGEIVKQLGDISRANKDVANFLKSRSYYDVRTGKRTQKGKTVDLLTKYSRGKTPQAIVAKEMKKSGAKTVNDFFAIKKNQKYARMLAKSGQSISNLITDAANKAIAGGAGANSKTMKDIAKLFYYSKGSFSTASKGGFMKDKIAGKDPSGNAGYFPIFGSMHRNYDEKTGKLTWQDTKNSQDYAFYKMLPLLRGSSQKLPKVVDETTSALETFAESLKGVGNWLEPFSKAFGGTPIGDIAGVFASAEKYGSQIMERLGYNNTEGITVSRMDSLGKLFESLGLGNLTGGEGAGAFSRGYKAMTGGLKALSPDDFARDAQGRNMGLKGRNTLFGKMGMGLGKLTSGKAFGGGKIGGAIGKAVGAAMKLPLGAMLGIAGGIASAAIGIFKFLAKHSPVLQAVEQMLNLFFTLFFMPIGNALGQVILPLMDGLFDWVLKWNDLWTDFSWDKFGGFLWDMIAQIPIAIYELAKQLVNNFFDRIRDFWLGFKDVFIGILKAFNVDEGTIKNIEGFFDTVASGIKAIRDWLESIFTGIQQYLSNPVEAVGNTLGDAWHNLTGLASGGIVQPTPSGTLALLAEGGEPEAVIPLSEMENVFGNTGGITVVINGDIYGMSDFESKVETVINRVSNRSAYR